MLLLTGAAADARAAAPHDGHAGLVALLCEGASTCNVTAHHVSRRYPSYKISHGMHSPFKEMAGFYERNERKYLGCP